MAQSPTTDELAGTAEQLTLTLPELGSTDMGAEFAAVFNQAEARAESLRYELDLIPDDDFATAIRLTPQTLATWRSDGTGPDYVKVGKSVFYRREDIKRWLDKRLNSVLATKAPLKEAA